MNQTAPSGARVEDVPQKKRRGGRTPANATEVRALGELADAWPARGARSLPVPSEADAVNMGRRLRYLGKGMGFRIRTQRTPDTDGYRVTFWIVERLLQRRVGRKK